MESPNFFQTTSNDHHSRRPSIYALLIGIDSYISNKIDNLDYCVADAEAMKTFLQSLGVPSQNITTLYNKQATRAAIKDALYALQNDTRIIKNDSILIYYAGHGAKANAPREWEVGGRHIQMILPHDCDANLVHGIPDRTISVLLDQLAKAKGNNITVILDCCHSGSGTRSEEEGRARGLDTVFDVPSNIDHTELATGDGGRGIFTPEEYIDTGLASHVLLAACHETGRAYEVSGGGEFTTALLRVLNSLNNGEISYKDLIRRIGKLPQQEPRCEGKHTDRIFLNRAITTHGPIKYRVTRELNEYKLNAGEAQGIAEGSTFTVYQRVPWIELGTLVASQPELFSTVLHSPPGHQPFEIGEEAVAIRIGAGDEEALRLYIAPDADPLLIQLMQEVISSTENDRGVDRKIMIVDSNLADLEAKYDQGHIVFDTLFEPATRHGMKRLHLWATPTVEAVRPVLRAAAHYYWHLRRALIARKDVFNAIKFIKLGKMEQSHFGDKLNVQVSQNGNLIENGVVNITADPYTPYGVRIKNKTTQPLYFWVYFFDHGDLTITELHRPLITGTEDVPLQAGHAIPIGYGDGGGQPFSFDMEDQYNMDIGYLAVFISTEPIDLSDMAQADSVRKLGRSKDKVPELADHWYTHVVPIVQRKASIIQ